MQDPVRGTFTKVDWYTPHPGRTPTQMMLTGFVEAPGIPRTAGEVLQNVNHSVELNQLPILIDRSAPSNFIVEWRQVPKFDGGSARARRAAQSATDNTP